MISRNFRINVIARVLILTACAVALYPVLRERLYIVAAFITIILIALIFSLIRYAERTNRTLAQFLQSIKYSDFSAGFTTGAQGRSFDELNRIYSEVVERFREINIEREENYQYLQAVVQHVGIGMIAFRPDGDVEFINAAAKKLFDIPRLSNISDLEPVSRELVDRLRTLEPGQSALIKVAVAGNLLQLSVYITELRLRRAALTLASFQNISSELDSKEMEAWQNLIRVLTHEIKNSLTPIASLTASMAEMISGQEEASCLDDEAMQDIHIALETIKKRSEGLLRFTEAYRSLTKIKRPEFERFQISGLISRVKNLSKQQIGEAPITIETRIDPPNLSIMADPELIEQVLINLTLNAIDAVEGKEEGRIEIAASIDERSHAVMQVIDNGRGITEEALEKIFIPFYSTKKDGSGIGLSLSRQIMRLHHGELTAKSEPGARTVFTMRF
jgi:nitrogen fixation/metabolism regulation signal transduction histidine kinase